MAGVTEALVAAGVLLAAHALVLSEAVPSTTTTATIVTTASSSTPSSDSATTRRTKPPWNLTDTDRLKHDLLLGYDKFARPHGHDQRTEVDLLVVMKHLEVDEFQGIMSLDVWIKMFWTDPKLTWKPSQYGNLSTLFVADHEIWQPDIMLYNSATHPGLSAAQHESPYLLVGPDGGVVWVPTTRLDVYCNLNLRHWPYDAHTCEFRMGSWVYDKASIDFITHNETFTHDPHVEGELWAVLDTHFERKETMYACCPESYVDVSLSVTAQRRGSAYHTVLVGPLFASTALLLLSFFVPLHRPEKVMVHGVNIIVLTISITYLTHIVPVLTDKTPLIVEVYGFMLFVEVGCAGVAIMLQNLTGMARPWPLPGAFKRVITHPHVRPLLVGACVDEVLETSRTSGGSPDSVAILPNAETAFESMSLEGGGRGAASLELAHARNRRDWNYFALLCERALFLAWWLVFMVVACVVG